MYTDGNDFPTNINDKIQNIKSHLDLVKKYVDSRFNSLSESINKLQIEEQKKENTLPPIEYYKRGDFFVHKRWNTLSLIVQQCL
jgi:hypothetical protein